MGDILGYARVSTGYQDLESQRQSQRQRLKNAGAIRIFKDIISGKRFDRPGLTAFLNYARPGDTIAVVRLDRLGRSLKELLETVDLLRQRKIALLSLEEKIDTSSAAGELIFHVFAAIAHFERRLIAERTKDGLLAATSKGRYPGRPRTDQEKLLSAFSLINQGISPTRAAKQFQIGRSTLYRALSVRNAG